MSPRAGRGLLRRRARPPAWARVRGALASASAGQDANLSGTRDALVVAHPDGEQQSWPWERLHGAEWDRDSATLTIRPLLTDGAPGEAVSFNLEDGDRLLQLVRERISASVVLQRPVRLTGGTVRLVGRRRPGAVGPISWTVDHGRLDPADPVVAAEVARAIEVVRGEAEA